MKKECVKVNEEVLKDHVSGETLNEISKKRFTKVSTGSSFQDIYNALVELAHECIPYCSCCDEDGRCQYIDIDPSDPAEYLINKYYPNWRKDIEQRKVINLISDGILGHERIFINDLFEDFKENILADHFSRFKIFGRAYQIFLEKCKINYIKDQFHNYCLNNIISKDNSSGSIINILGFLYELDDVVSFIHKEQEQIVDPYVNIPF